MQTNKQKDKPDYQEINFDVFNEQHLKLIYTWFKNPQVNKWYAGNKAWTMKSIQDKYLPRLLGDENVPSYIILFNQKKIGFIQYYYLNDFLPDGVNSYAHQLFNLAKPDNIIGMDLFIGDEEFIGKSYGSRIISKFLDEYILPICQLIVIDPKNDNYRAIKSYEKAGFNIFTIIPESNTCLMIYRNM